MSDKCQFCSASFGLLTKKLACKVCGRVLCKKCSQRELLLYVPDGEGASRDKRDVEVHMAVIRIIGVSVTVETKFESNFEIY